MFLNKIKQFFKEQIYFYKLNKLIDNLINYRIKESDTESLGYIYFLNEFKNGYKKVLTGNYYNKTYFRLILFGYVSLLFKSLCNQSEIKYINIFNDEEKLIEFNNGIYRAKHNLIANFCFDNTELMIVKEDILYHGINGRI